jgi:predicted adenine nucleotide alpha hydrolase (AANH) superfamily ATPase
VFGYFFNPNIHPYTEFMKRLEYVEIHNRRAGIDYFADGEYNLRRFVKTALNAEEKDSSRCRACYGLRLNAAAKFAAQSGFSVFTTTLLYSRRQDHNAVISIGEESAALNGIDFYYEDFRAGWQEGIKRSKELDMYRQNYCGCIFSEEERYAAKIAAAVKPDALKARAAQTVRLVN